MDARNVWKGRRQEAKAHAVSRLIWARLSREERLNPALPETVAKMSEGERFGWACEAQVPQLSDESWALVVSKIEERRIDELHWLGIEERAS